MELGSGIGRVLALCLALGVSSFVVGILPLSFTFSARRRAQLSTFGNGLLLGAALGIIIPESVGAETIVASRREAETSSLSSQIALSLIVGFTFMLVIEQIFAIHDSSRTSTLRNIKTFRAAADQTEEYDLDDTSGIEDGRRKAPEVSEGSGSVMPFQAYSLTLGLVMHSLADGLALGASSVGDNENSTLSILVFVALIVHKVPTALALTSSLLSTSLSKIQIRRHIVVFSAATPIGALASFIILNILETQVQGWTGIILLISGGSFLYVATIIQSVGVHHSQTDLINDELPKTQRLLLLIGGILLPKFISTIFGHGHGGNELT